MAAARLVSPAVPTVPAAVLAEPAKLLAMLTVALLPPLKVAPLPTLVICLLNNQQQVVTLPPRNKALPNLQLRGPRPKLATPN
ncbi:MAG: hypothetical protein KDA80_07160 [Planctomycetaceae bacterium]|nr:hypothetical protein [Planctomycetaceae bacterium]